MPTSATLIRAHGLDLKGLREFGLTTTYVGVAIGVTLWMSNLSDYMLLEDLGLEETEAASELWKVSPGERLLLNMSILLGVVGLGSYVLAIILSGRPRDRPRNSEPKI